MVGRFHPDSGMVGRGRSRNRGVTKAGRCDTVPMSKKEARQIASVRIAELRRQSYVLLKERWLDNPDCEEVTAPSGAVYQVETEAFLDDPKRSSGNLRVFVSVGSWLMPPCDSFIIAPDGSFVGD